MEDCRLKSKCKKYKNEGCPEFCIKLFKIDKLCNNALMSNVQRQHINLRLDEDGSDRDAFIYLKKIEDNIEEFIKEGNNLYIYSSNCGNGKAQPDDSKILTPHGYVRMADIKLFDNIMGDDGHIHQVIGKYDRGQKDVYRITFSDRSQTECCDEHLWNISDRCSINKEFKTVELKELIGKNLRRSQKGGWRYQIPITKPLNFGNKVESPLHPYVLGYILGDGNTSKNGGVNLTISPVDSECAISCMRDLLPLGYFIKKSNSSPYSYHITSNDLKFGCKFHSECKSNIIKEELKKYNIIENKAVDKCIPEAFLFSSIEDRISLIQGLMDTDGTVIPGTNNLSFSTVSEKLAEQFAFLVQSLGGTVTICKKQNRKYHYVYKDTNEYKKCSDTYYCQVKLPREIVPFRFKRKIEAYANNQQNEPYRAIRNIEYLGKKHCYCIMTNNPSHLYITDNCIVTHNTSWALRLLNSYFSKIWATASSIDCRGLFINVPKFLISLKDNITQKSDYIQHIKEHVLTADVVVWDDIATKGFTQFEMENVLNIINNRIDAGKSNIYTSNLIGEDLRDAVGERLYSRIINMSTTLTFVGQDKRGL